MGISLGFISITVVEFVLIPRRCTYSEGTKAARALRILRDFAPLLGHRNLRKIFINLKGQPAIAVMAGCHVVVRNL
jgi:hypothetical protein